jgi:hypothetical protein
MMNNKQRSKNEYEEHFNRFYSTNVYNKYALHTYIYTLQFINRYKRYIHVVLSIQMFLSHNLAETVLVRKDQFDSESFTLICILFDRCQYMFYFFVLSDKKGR